MRIYNAEGQSKLLMLSANLYRADNVAAAMAKKFNFAGQTACIVDAISDGQGWRMRGARQRRCVATDRLIGSPSVARCWHAETVLSGDTDVRAVIASWAQSDVAHTLVLRPTGPPVQPAVQKRRTFQQIAELPSEAEPVRSDAGPANGTRSAAAKATQDTRRSVSQSTEVKQPVSSARDEKAAGEAATHSSRPPVQKLLVAVATMSRAPNAYDDTALPFNEGDEIIVKERSETGVWVGSCGGREGHFPSTYVQLLSDDSTE